MEKLQALGVGHAAVGTLALCLGASAWGATPGGDGLPLVAEQNKGVSFLKTAPVLIDRLLLVQVRAAHRDTTEGRYPKPLVFLTIARVQEGSRPIWPGAKSFAVVVGGKRVQLEAKRETQQLGARPVTSLRVLLPWAQAKQAARGFSVVVAGQKFEVPAAQTKGLARLVAQVQQEPR